MQFTFFRSFAAAALFGTIVSTAPSLAADSTGVPATSKSPNKLSVVQLDLAGVRADAITSLPSPDSVPLEDSAAAPTASTGQAVIQQASFAVVRAKKQRNPHPEVLTAKLDTKPFTVMGVTWDRTSGLGEVAIRYRVRESGTWSRWSGVGASDAAPDPGTPDAKSGTRGGTDPIVAVDANGLQIWAETSTGTLSGVKAVLVDPGADPVGVNATNASFQTAATTAPTQPTIISRAGWGANESLRRCSPDYSNSMVSAAVHHTASANAYPQSAVAGIIRGIYAFHTSGQGWCDIGYNFLVDRFGTIYEGRAGGITSTVVGAHTGGFNSRTIGIAAIGDYGAVAAPKVMVDAISSLIAWKFSVHHIRAGGSVTLVSAGGESKYPAGTVVTFNTIYGHRDAGLTACPGQNLYNQLPGIRSAVASLANASVAVSPVGTVDVYSAAPSGVTVQGWALDPESTAALTIQVSIDGAVRTLTANTSRPDVGRIYGKGDNHGFSGVVTAGNGRHVVCVTAVNIGQGRSTVLGCQWVTMQNANPIGALDLVSTTTTSITVTGWALDRDTIDPISVHAYLDGHISGITANTFRPDVGRIFGKGDNHGFNATLTTTQGTHQLCLYLINTPTGNNPRLDCRTITTR
jgi:N-acetylmuramoyl-L-alanine amidase